MKFQKNSFFQTSLVFVMLGFLSSCVENSPLSDVDVTDPALLSPDVRLTRTIDERGQPSDDVTIWVFDKNKNSVELKKGEVRMNGSRLKVDYIPLTSAPYYRSGVKVDINSPYKVEVELSDGKIYTSTITTQTNAFDRFTAPTTHSKGADMEISWVSADPSETIVLNMDCNGKNAKGETMSATQEVYMPVDAVKAGKFSIPKDRFNDCENVSSVKLSLSSLKKGTSSDKFSASSVITSTFMVVKEVIVK